VAEAAVGGVGRRNVGITVAVVAQAGVRRATSAVNSSE